MHNEDYAQLRAFVAEGIVLLPCRAHRLCDGTSSCWSTARTSNCCSMRLLRQVSSAGTACSTISSAVALRLPSAGWLIILYADVCSFSLLACGRRSCDGTGFKFTLSRRAASTSAVFLSWLLQDGAAAQCSRDGARAASSSLSAHRSVHQQQLHHSWDRERS